MTDREMNCPSQTGESPEILVEYAAGRLGGPRAALLESHIESCRDCTDFLADQSAVWAALDEWVPAPASHDFTHRLWRRIEAIQAGPWYRRFASTFQWRAWKPAIPLAAAVVVVAAGFIMDHQGGWGQMPSGPSAAGVSVIEVDQVEKTLDDIQLLKQFDSNGTDAGARRTL